VGWVSGPASGLQRGRGSGGDDRSSPTLVGATDGALVAQDGVTLALYSRLLVKNEAAPANNGIYVLIQPGDASHPYILTRSDIADTAALLGELVVFVTAGATQSGETWFLPLTAGAITIGTTALQWLLLPAMLGQAPANGAVVNVLDYGAVADYNSATHAGTDNRPWIQDAINALGAAGGEVFVPPGNYKLVTPQRTTNPSTWAPDGCVLLIPANVYFRGVQGQSALWQRGFGDVALATTWQVVAGQVWRGNFFYVLGAVAPPGPSIGIDGLIVDGGAGYTGYSANVGGLFAGSYFPANTALNTPNGPNRAGVNIAAGDGWDVTHKGIACQPNPVYTGQIYVSRTAELRNFRGEVVFQGGPNGGRADIFGYLHSTNADAVSISSAGARVDARIDTCGFAAIECGLYAGAYDFGALEISAVDGQAISLFTVAGTPAPGILVKIGGAGSSIRGAASGLVLQEPVNYSVGDIDLYDCGQYFSNSTARAVSVFGSGTAGIVNTRLEDLRIWADTVAGNIAVGGYEDGVITKGLYIDDIEVLQTASAIANGHGYIVPLDLSTITAVRPAFVVGPNVFATGCTYNNDDLRRSPGPVLLTTTNPTLIAKYSPGVAPAICEVGAAPTILIDCNLTLYATFKDADGNAKTYYWFGSAAGGVALNTTEVTKASPITINPQAAGNNFIEVWATSSVANAASVVGYIENKG
jgi:hypothetical protein